MNTYKIVDKFRKYEAKLEIIKYSIQKVIDAQLLVSKFANTIINDYNNKKFDNDYDKIIDELRISLTEIGMDKKIFEKYRKEPEKLIKKCVKFCVTQIYSLKRINNKIIKFVKKHTYYFENEEKENDSIGKRLILEFPN